MRGRSIPWTLSVGALLVAFGCYSGGPLEPPPAKTSTPLTASTRRIRRLSSREYDNVVRDLLGDDSHRSQTFVVDSYQNGYDNGSAGLAVQSDQIVGYQAAAETLAANAVTRDIVSLLGGCVVADRGEPACLESFLSTTAARAYRRPLTPTELDRLRTVHQSEAANGFARGIQTMLEVILQSPQFLYREELGPIDAVATPGESVRLTDYEIASELSFLLTGSMPDAQLWADVANGSFKTVDDLRRVATRLLASPGAKSALVAFMHEWLGTDRLATLSKDARVYPTFDASMAASMSSELDRYYGEVLFADGGSLRRLFSPSQGVLSRPGFLAVHAATDSSGPIARGVFVLQAIMCAPPPPPPANVPPAVPATDPVAKNLTTRERFDKHVSSSFCAGCHKQIDGIGFGFEEFDGIGVFRTTEAGQKIDASGTIVGTGEIDGNYVGVAELTGKLAGSKLLASCFVRQAYRYAMGQIEPFDVDFGPLGATFDTDAQLTDLLISIVVSPIFVNRVFEPSPSP